MMMTMMEMDININNRTTNSSNNATADKASASLRPGKKDRVQNQVTMAQREATANIERYLYSSEKQGIRKSKRLLSFLSHPKIKTSKLRRLNELFWFNDDRHDKRDGDGDNNGDDKHGGSGETIHASVSDNKTPKNGTNTSCTYKVSPRLHLKRIHSSPNIYTIDNFLTESELIFLEKKIRFANEKRLFHDSFIDKGDGGGGGGGGGKQSQKKVGRKRKRKQTKEEGSTSTCSQSHECDVVEQNTSFNNNDVNGKDENGTSCTTQEATEHVQFQHEQDPIQPQGDGSTTASTSGPPCERTSTSNKKHQHPYQQRQRTSKFIHFTKLSNSVITSIEQRACELLSLPNHCIEPLQLVKYDIGQYFNVHHDLGILYDDGSVELPHRKNALLSPPRRIVTVLVYLNDVLESHGGSTQFPLLRSQSQNQRNTNTKRNDSNENDCDTTECSKCLEIYPKRGMALIWCNIKKDGTPDERVVHSGQPLVSSDSSESDWNSNSAPVKYVMNIWACED